MARLTCSIIAPHDHTVTNHRRPGRSRNSRLLVLPFPGVHPAADHDPPQDDHVSLQDPLPTRGGRQEPVPLPGHPADGLCPGVAELAAAVREGRPSRLSERYSLHVNEMVVAIDQARDSAAPYNDDDDVRPDRTDALGRISPLARMERRPRDDRLQPGRSFDGASWEPGRSLARSPRIFAFCPTPPSAAVGSRSRDRAQAFLSEFGGAGRPTDGRGLARTPKSTSSTWRRPTSGTRTTAWPASTAAEPCSVEKPFTVDAAEARAVIDQARRSRRFCMEAMWMRFHPLILKVHSMVQSGDARRDPPADRRLRLSDPLRSREPFFNQRSAAGPCSTAGSIRSRWLTSCWEVPPRSSARPRSGPPASTSSKRPSCPTLPALWPSSRPRCAAGSGTRRSSSARKDASESMNRFTPRPGSPGPGRANRSGRRPRPRPSSGGWKSRIERKSAAPSRSRASPRSLARGDPPRLDDH